MENETEEQNPFSLLSDEELEVSEVALLREAGSREESSDEEYQRHYEYIRRVRKSNDSTHKRFTKRSVYSDERLAIHEKLLSTLEEEHEAIPSEGKAIFIGGMSGSGKSTFLRLQPKLLGKVYAVANPDDIKLKMLELSMAPEIPGLLPLETDELIRYEASVLDGQVLAKLISRRKNVVIDRTMGSVSQILKLRESLRENGYETVEGYFMDIAPEDAYERITARHRSGLDRYLLFKDGLGERPVPGTAIKASQPKDGSPFLTANAEVFHKLVSDGVFTEAPKIVDSMSGKSLTLEELRRNAG